MGIDHGNLAMHATLMDAKSHAKPNGGKTYTLQFMYPRGYLQYVDDVLGMKVDVYWDEQVIAHSAEVKKAWQKPVKDSDPLYLFSLECDPNDTSLANLNDAVDTVGDLRLALTQMAAFSKS